MRKSLATVMALAAVVLIGGCATQEAFEAKLRAWEGRNINDFIAKVEALYRNRRGEPRRYSGWHVARTGEACRIKRR